NLPVHWLNDWMLCLDVECGMRDETVLHRLYGTVTSYEPDTGRVGFSPTGGHPAIWVPVHRIVALTGDRHRRTDGQVPAHEPYEEQKAVRLHREGVALAPIQATGRVLHRTPHPAPEADAVNRRFTRPGGAAVPPGLSGAARHRCVA
ncbi:hypothetical protein ACH4FA_30150, partial [Streptomyces sp. NPDC017966]|uniref:hypothetical protein n=1 Tax=Streptomyces sp. NPDC017966 TaxID=3365023 RepID=UPI00378E22BB